MLIITFILPRRCVWFLMALMSISFSTFSYGADEKEKQLSAEIKDIVVLAVTFDNWFRAEYSEKKTGFMVLVDQSKVKRMQEMIAKKIKSDENQGSRLLYPIKDHNNKESMIGEAEDNFKQMSFTEVVKGKQFVVKVPCGASVGIMRIKDKLVVSGYEPVP